MLALIFMVTIVVVVDFFPAGFKEEFAEYHLARRLPDLWKTSQYFQSKCKGGKGVGF